MPFCFGELLILEEQDIRFIIYMFLTECLEFSNLNDFIYIFSSYLCLNKSFKELLCADIFHNHGCI